MSQETVVDGVKVVMRRTYAAPVEKLYQAWTDPGQMVRWLSPNERFNAPTIVAELRPGGRHNITMNHSDGDQFQVVGKYVEVVPNERVSFTWTFVGSPTEADETLVTVEFRAVPGGTELTLTHDRQTDSASREETTQGWTECLGMLGKYLEGGPALAAK